MAGAQRPPGRHETGAYHQSRQPQSFLLCGFRCSGTSESVFTTLRRHLGQLLRQPQSGSDWTLWRLLQTVRVRLRAFASGHPASVIFLAPRGMPSGCYIVTLAGLLIATSVVRGRRGVPAASGVSGLGCSCCGSGAIRLGLSRWASLAPADCGSVHSDRLPPPGMSPGPALSLPVVCASPVQFLFCGGPSLGEARNWLC